MQNENLQLVKISKTVSSAGGIADFLIPAGEYDEQTSFETVYTFADLADSIPVARGDCIPSIYNANVIIDGVTRGLYQRLGVAQYCRGISKSNPQPDRNGLDDDVADTGATISCYRSYQLGQKLENVTTLRVVMKIRDFLPWCVLLDNQKTFSVKTQMQVQLTASVFVDVLSGYAGGANNILVHAGGAQCDVTSIAFIFLGIMRPNMTGSPQNIIPIYEQNTQAGASSNFNYHINTISPLQTYSITDTAVTANAIDKTGQCTIANLTALTLIRNGFQQVSASTYQEACNNCSMISDCDIHHNSPNIIYKKNAIGSLNMTTTGVGANSSTVYGVQTLHENI